MFRSRMLACSMVYHDPLTAYNLDSMQFHSNSNLIDYFIYLFIYANLVILATAVTYYQLSGGESWTLRWLRSLLDKMDLFIYIF